MIIFFQNNEKIKVGLLKLIAEHQTLHKDLYEKDFYIALKDAEEKLGIKVKVEPEVDLDKPRFNRGWKYTTLRYFVSYDDFGLNLPEAEILATKHEVNESFKIDTEDLIHIDKPELLRDLKALDIQLNKLIKKVEGGQW